jgi:glycerol-3-phosphate O-acyltransferase/dihydroxyacetone phosphate acyltransferase
VLYFITKILTNIFYRVYYRIDFVGKDRVPSNQPVILSPNHTNAFVDPVAIAMSLPQKVRFFARGDVFKGKLAKWTLDALSISPMYRIQEGYSELKKNDKTFEECRSLLSNNKTILLFPEAICIQEPRLQPLKKGLARIVFQTEELFDFKKNVLIVPIGLNYSNAKKFRSRLFINFGEAISIKNYEASFKEDKVKTLNEFTKFLEVEMTKLLITVNNKESDILFEQLTEIYLDEWMLFKNYNLNNIEHQYKASKEIAEMLNYFGNEKPTLLKTLNDEVLEYTTTLKKHHLPNELLNPTSIETMNLVRFISDALILFFGLPIYWLAWITNAIPYVISKRFADQKIKKAEFYASIYANMSMLLWVIYYFIQLASISLITKNASITFLSASIIPLLGLYALNFYPVMKKINGRLNLLKLVRKQRSIIEKLMTLRAQTFSDIEFARNEYIKQQGK